MDEHLIGKRIKKYRVKEGLTLQKLASLTGFTKSYLSQIEKSPKAPPISTLTMIARCLGVETITLLSDENMINKNISFVKRNERVRISRSGDKYGLRYEAVEHKGPGKAFMAYILTVPFEEKAIFRHEGEEMHFVLEGSVKCNIGGQEFIAEEGDCLYFDSGIPHSAVSIGKVKAKMLTVAYPAGNESRSKAKSSEAFSLIADMDEI